MAQYDDLFAPKPQEYQQDDEFDKEKFVQEKQQDPFWDTSASMLLSALIFYLLYEAPEYEQNFAMVLELLKEADVKEEDENYQSSLDILFSQLEAVKPDHIAVGYYKDYRGGAGKTLKSINITLASRLEKFNLSTMKALTATDELELDKVGEEKTAIFACIPDNDTSFNFVIGMLYTQLFQQLYYCADFIHGGRLPVHVHFVMDEFSVRP